MEPSTAYQLLDFGNGRRLERFGPVTLDRPCPAAELLQQADPQTWTCADARFEGREQDKGQWIDRRELPDRWNVRVDRLQFELKRTDFGHVGIFPEQIENWRWIDKQCRLIASSEANKKLKILNLFAYTGGSTLAAAAAGAEVVHVDAARNVIAWARRNAELSGLADAPVRWIAEDAVKFVARELKRGNRYDALILDPPTYGHGPQGEVWQLSKHLPGLLDLCREVTAGRLEFLLLTCHTPSYDAETLSELVQEHLFRSPSGWMKARPLLITTDNDRSLPSGMVLEWRRKAQTSTL